VPRTNFVDDKTVYIEDAHLAHVRAHQSVMTFDWQKGIPAGANPEHFTVDIEGGSSQQFGEWLVSASGLLAPHTSGRDFGLRTEGRQAATFEHERHTGLFTVASNFVRIEWMCPRTMSDAEWLAEYTAMSLGNATRAQQRLEEHQQREVMRASFGIDAPVALQLGEWIQATAQEARGRSVWDRTIPRQGGE
jgi:hypothetical protein